MSSSVPVVTGGRVDCGCVDASGCLPGEECLPSDYIDPSDCPPSACPDGEECLPSDYIDPADCPACDSCCEGACSLEVNGLSDASSAVASSSFTSGAFTPSDHATLVAFVSLQSTGDFGDHSDEVTIDDTAGLVWERQGHGVNGAEQSFAPMLAVFTAHVTAGASMTVTIGGFGYLTAILNLVEVVNTTEGSVVVGACTFKTDLADDGADAITIPAPALNSIVIAARATGAGSMGVSINATPDASAAEVFDVSLDGSQGMQLETRTGDASTTIGWADVASNVGYAGVAAAIELLCSTTPDCACDGDYVPYCLNNDGTAAADVQAAILATTPFSYYTFDGSGTGGDDQTGNGHAFTFADGTFAADTAITAKCSGSTKMTGGARAQAPNPTGGDMSGASVEWANVCVLQIDAFDAGIGGSGPFAWLSYTAAAGSPFKFMATIMATTGRAGIITDTNFGDGAKYAYSRDPFVFALGEPHVVVINKTDKADTSNVHGMFEMWVDGVLWLTCPSAGIGTAGDSFTIGRSRDNFFGAMDMHVSNWIVYDHSLTNADIQMLTELLADDAILANGLVIAS